MNPEATLDVLRQAAAAVKTAGDAGPSCDTARAIQAAVNALQSQLADTLRSINTTRDHEGEGASSITTWARRELQLDAGETRRLVRAAETMDSLPAVREAAERGSLRGDHVNLFTYARRFVGPGVVRDHQGWLLQLARACEPSRLKSALRELRQAAHPDELEEAWIRGMDRRDISLSAVPDGFHVSGFLDILTGAKFKALLDSLSVPRDADDGRKAAERRMDGLNDVLDSILESGLPSDKGVRPQLNVLVDAETLSDALENQPGLGGPARTTATPAAELVGFGSISSGLLAQIQCTSDFTPVLIDRNRSVDDPHHVLDVGRTRRLATPRQRRAVLTRQGFECATPGCHHRHLEIHHVHWWSRGGQTNMTDLAGYCVKCHHLVHAGLLVIERTDDGRLTTRRPATGFSSRLRRTDIRAKAWQRRLDCDHEPHLPRPDDRRVG